MNANRIIENHLRRRSVRRVARLSPFDCQLAGGKGSMADEFVNDPIGSTTQFLLQMMCATEA